MRANIDSLKNKTPAHLLADKTTTLFAGLIHAIVNVTIPPRDQWVVRFSFDRPRPRPPPTDDRHIVREPSPRMCRRFRNRRAKSHGAAGVGGTEGANLAAFCDPSSLPSLPPLIHCLSSFSSDFWGGQWNGATSERRSESVSRSVPLLSVQN